MNAREHGFLLLASSLGDSERHPLTVAQLRTLAKRVRIMDAPTENRELCEADLMALGYGPDMYRRILKLLGQEAELSYYLHKAKRMNCIPVTRISSAYPGVLHQRLQLDCPGVLWAKGDVSILNSPRISLVGSRDIRPENRQFAAEAGRQAAYQGYTLISGNARGADRTAQESCLAAGGRVVIVVADSLADKKEEKNVLYLSEDSFDLPFSAQRALSRNRVIHCLGTQVLVAQCDYQTGGTWSGTAKNLAANWSPVYCFADGSAACESLSQMGAERIGMAELFDLGALSVRQKSFLDQEGAIEPNACFFASQSEWDMLY